MDATSLIPRLSVGWSNFWDNHRRNPKDSWRVLGRAVAVLALTLTLWVPLMMMMTYSAVLDHGLEESFGLFLGGSRWAGLLDWVRWNVIAGVLVIAELQVLLRWSHKAMTTGNFLSIVFAMTGRGEEDDARKPEAVA